MFRRPQPENFVNYQLQASLGATRPAVGKIPIKRRKKTKAELAKIRQRNAERKEQQVLLRQQDIEKRRAVYRPDRLLEIHQSALTNSSRTAQEIGRGLTATGTTLGFERRQERESEVEKAKARVLLALANRMESNQPLFNFGGGGYAQHRQPDDFNAIRLPNRPAPEIQDRQAQAQAQAPTTAPVLQRVESLEPLLVEEPLEEVTPTPRPQKKPPPAPPPPPPSTAPSRGERPQPQPKPQPEPQSDRGLMLDQIRNFQFNKKPPVKTSARVSLQQPEPEPEQPPSEGRFPKDFLSQVLERASRPRQFIDPLENKQPREFTPPQSELFERVTGRRSAIASPRDEPFVKPPPPPTEPPPPELARLERPKGISKTGIGQVESATNLEESAPRLSLQRQSTLPPTEPEPEGGATPAPRSIEEILDDPNIKDRGEFYDQKELIQGLYNLPLDVQSMVGEKVIPERQDLEERGFDPRTLAVVQGTSQLPADVQGLVTEQLREVTEAEDLKDWRRRDAHSDNKDWYSLTPRQQEIYAKSMYDDLKENDDDFEELIERVGKYSHELGNQDALWTLDNVLGEDGYNSDIDDAEARDRGYDSREDALESLEYARKIYDDFEEGKYDIDTDRERFETFKSMIGLGMFGEIEADDDGYYVPIQDWVADHTREPFALAGYYGTAFEVPENLFGGDYPEESEESEESEEPEPESEPPSRQSSIQSRQSSVPSSVPSRQSSVPSRQSSVEESGGQVEEDVGENWLNSLGQITSFHSGKSSNQLTGQTYSFVDTDGVIGRGKFKGQQVTIIGVNKNKNVLVQLTDTIGTGIVDDEPRSNISFKKFEKLIQEGVIDLKPQAP